MSEPDDRFEHLARTAGEELRRPAPADGVARLHSSRRRRQGGIVAGVITATVVVIASGVLIVADGNDGRIGTATTPSTSIIEDGTAPPDSRFPSTSLADPIVANSIVTGEFVTGVPPGGGVTTTVPPSSNSLVAWAARQSAAGRDQTEISDGIGTSARMLVAHQTGDYSDLGAAILLDDGTVAELPEAAAADTQLVGVGDRVAIVTRNTATRMFVLADDRETWEPGPDLGPTPTQSGMRIDPIGDGGLLIGFDHWVDDGDGFYVPADDRRGVAISGDLTVVEMSAPPAGVPMAWTSTTKDHALLLGLDAAAGANDPLRQPWAYNASANAWEAVSTPDWVECPPEGCHWNAPHEFGDPNLELATPDGVVKRLPDGSIGLYVPSTATWTQLDAAPLTLATPTTAVVDNFVVVAPVRPPEHPEEFGTLAVLDLDSGTWSTNVIAELTTTEMGSYTGWALQVIGQYVTASVRGADGTPAGQWGTFDAAIGEWGSAIPIEQQIEFERHWVAPSIATADLRPSLFQTE